MIKIISYKCSECDIIYPDEAAALRCELRHAEDAKCNHPEYLCSAYLDDCDDSVVLIKECLYCGECITRSIAVCSISTDEELFNKLWELARV